MCSKYAAIAVLAVEARRKAVVGDGWRGSGRARGRGLDRQMAAFRWMEATVPGCVQLRRGFAATRMGKYGKKQPSEVVSTFPSTCSLVASASQG